MTSQLARKYAVPVPRYTSYPTAPHFTGAVGRDQYLTWLGALPAGQCLSLYVHIPYCHSLCWYCGCNTKATRRYEPVARYLESLLSEVEAIAARLPADHAVTHLHWGGGSPNMLRPADIERLAGAIGRRVRIASDAEFAVEIDPRWLEPEQAAAFVDAGVNRVSIGVQDFDEAVQAAIGRQQSLIDTTRAIDAFRALGVEAINIDLMYGLPHQTVGSVTRTIEQVLSLAPQRIAIFGYAHLPQRMRQQRLIDQASLPGPEARLEQAERLAATLTARGYVRVGLDHFARVDDPLATGYVRRNFQGYTSDDAEVLIGLGASAIGRLPQGYVQNAVASADYARLVADGGLATVKGIALNADDRVRAHTIERLMCDLAVSTDELERRFGRHAAPVIADLEAIVRDDEDGLVVARGPTLHITESGRPFVRSICARIDAYFRPATGRHATGV